MRNKYIYTADVEEPNCMTCDFLQEGSDKFCAECGDNYWCHYRRTETIGQTADTEKPDPVW